MPKSEAIEQLTKLGGGNIASGIASAAECVDDLAVGAKIAATSSGDLETVFSGLGTTILGALSTPLGMFTATTGGIALVAGAAHLAYKTFFDYGTAAEKAQESASAYQADLSGLNSLQSALANTKAQIEGIQSKGKLTLTDEADLSRLQQQSTALEQRIAIQEKLAEVSGKVASKNAEDALGKLVTSEASKYIDDEQTYSKLKVGRQKMTNAQALDLDVEKIKEYQKEVDKLREKQQKKGTSSSEFDQYQKEIDEYQKKLDVLDAEAAGFANNIQTQLGNITDKGSAVYKENQNSLNDYLTMGMSKQEKGAYSIDSYFDGSAGKNLIKDQLIQAASEGKNVESVLNSLGLKLSDLGDGVNSEMLTKYFEGLSDSAAEAADAVNKVNNNLTMDDIRTAFESKNAGDDYISLNDYLKKAKDLYDKGLVGTDDFKAVAEAISYGVDSSAESFSTNYEKLQRYFIEDDSGNLTSQGLNNFLTDLQSLDKGYAQYNETIDENGNVTGKWTLNMDNTAQAAKDLGISVQSMEAILGRLQDYDNVGDINFRSAIESFDTAKQSIEGIELLLDSMAEGDRKEALTEDVENWKSQLDGWEQDLSTLDTNLVMHIELEYDLASIQAQIDEAQQLIDGGDNSVENHAKVIGGNQKYIDTAEKGVGFGTEGVIIPVEYTANEDTIEALRNQLNNASSEGDKIKIQAEIENLQEVQKQLLDSFAEAHPEINAESSMEEVNAKWEEFISTTEGQEIITKMTADDEEAKEKVGDLLGMTPEQLMLPIYAEAGDAIATIDYVDQKEIHDKIAGLVGEDNATPIMTLWNTLQADPKFTLLSANDQATSLVAYWNMLTPEEKQAVMTTTINTSDNATPTLAGVDGKINSMNLNPAVNIMANDKASSAVTIVSQGLSQLNGKTAHTYIVTHNTTTGPFKINPAKINGTAHKDGTSGSFSPFQKPSACALAVGTLQDNSWLKPSWKTKEPEVALTGEVGQELVVHGNRWWTVGDQGAEFSPIPQGSVVFNARQTRDLLNKGFTNSRGTAHLSGTAYASGSTDQAAKDALKELSNYFNWITINMDRLSRQSKLASNTIENAVGLSKKQAATSEAISKVREERNAVTQGSKKYLEHAEWYARESGLSADLQKKVQNGTIDISKYDEDTQAKIKEYQQYYEKYLDMLDKATDLEKKESDLVEKRLKNIESFYKLVTKVSESVQDMNDAKLKYEAAKGYSAVSDQVKAVYQSSLKESQNTYNSLSKQLVDYQTEFDTLVKNGSITKGSDQWYEGLAKINGFQEDIYKAGVTIVEYEDKIRGIEYTKLENLISGFERAVKSLDGRMSLKKARDEKISESDYQTNINLNNSTIRENMKLRDKKLKEQSLYDVNSKEYEDAAKYISNLDKETYNLLVDNEKLKDSIFELRFTPLDEGIEKYQDLRSELKNFQGLLNKDAFFDKNGAITETGLANLALLQQQLATTKKEIADYKTGLDKLSDSYKNGVISEKEYNEKSQEYRKGIQDAAGDVVDYQEKLTDLYMTQMKAEVDALQEVIDKRKDALDAKADYYDYDKKLKSQTKDVNVLKAQIAAMEGVNDAATQAKVKQLKQQLTDAEDKLGETKRDHAIDMQKQGYNGLSDDMEKMLDDTEYEIIHNSEKQQSVIESMLSNVVNMYESAYGKINSIIANTGWVGSTDFNSNQSQLSTQTGASKQTAGATQSQSSTKSSTAANSTKTSSISNDDAYHNKTVESELAKPENTTNRLVAEIKLSATSVTLEEGQTTTVSVDSIRPTDAKNKTLSWRSDNSQIANISNGTIRAVKQGSCQIFASATDGSGISAKVSVTVTKKPDPPKPQPKPKQDPVKSGGATAPKIGDAVTFINGFYYSDSNGSSPRGKQMLGQTVYITYMNPNAPYPIHISGTSKPGERDLGWLSLKELKGYKTGSRNIDKEQLAWTQEDGRELIMRKSDGAMLTKLNPGDAVAPNDLTENLFKWGEVNPQTFFANAINMTPNIPVIPNAEQNVSIEQHYDSLIHIEGNVDQGVLADLKTYEKDFLDKSYKYTTNMIAKDCQKVGIRRK